MNAVHQPKQAPVMHLAPEIPRKGNAHTAAKVTNPFTYRLVCNIDFHIQPSTSSLDEEKGGA
jgi:hypothetical protein